jgi:hypothetical protein
MQHNAQPTILKMLFEAKDGSSRLCDVEGKMPLHYITGETPYETLQFLLEQDQESSN